MAEDRNIHWTDDDELLSKFVLHQLPASEEKSLSFHLDTCEKCRAAVNEETTIVAGAKLAGRAALKGRLRLLLSESEHRATASTMRKPVGYQIHWTPIASLAAVVTIIITVGVYNDWFGSSFWNKSTPQEEIAQEKGPSPPAPAKKETQKSMPENLEGKGLAQSASSAEQDHVNKPQTKRTQFLKEKASEDKRLAHEGSGTSVRAEPRGNTGAGVVADEGRKAENELQMNDESVAQGQQTFWVEGYVIADALARNRGMLSATPRNQVSNIRKDEATRKNDDRQVSMTGAGTAMPTISLSQEPSSSLPASFQYRQDRQGVIQTLIENKDNAIQMTLYLDSLMADSELRSANIEVVNNDSLILNLSSKRIGFRLPPALQNQANTKPNK